jgi:hypothetical protein
MLTLSCHHRHVDADAVTTGTSTLRSSCHHRHVDADVVVSPPGRRR